MMKMKKLNQLLPDVEEYVTGLFTREWPDGLVYHNIDHTLRVVKNAELIGTHENLNEEEMDIVKIAAWFHDVGYLKQYRDHEEVSIQIAEGFLNGKGVERKHVERITECIRSTVIPQHPADKVSAVLCDADMMHLGMEQYPGIIGKLRYEWENMGVRSLSEKKFTKKSIKILMNHKFHTAYCRKELSGIKEQNLKNLASSLSSGSPLTGKKLKASRKAKTGQYSRGADSMLRLTARNQISLSSIADNKSNILISLNGIIISLGLALLVRKFEERPEFIIPTLIFLIFSLATIVLAILSTRPDISSGKSGSHNVRSKKVNLLFFGNFYKMDIEEYESEVEELFNDDPYLYSAMIRDQYYLGKVLARKYRLLRLTYGVFMIGLIVSVGSFILVYLPI